MSETEDKKLLERIKSGDGHAFATLVRKHNGKFHGLAYRYTNNREEAEDIVQEAFLKLWQKPNLWNPEKGAKFTTWFYRLVINLCLDKGKKKSYLSLELEELIEDRRDLQDKMLANSQELVLLEREIAGLPERQRTALNLCFYEGMSNKEAAEIMNLNLKALQSLVMRAKTTLQKKLKMYI